jgi:hypothetical protein
MSHFERITTHIDTIFGIVQHCLPLDNEEKEVNFLSGMFVLLCGYFEQFIHDYVSNFKSDDENFILNKRLASVFKNIKEDLANARYISVQRLVNWYKNPGPLSPSGKFSENLEALEVLLSIQKPESKEAFSKLIRDYKCLFVEPRNAIAHGNQESIESITLEKLESLKDTILKIVEYIK